MNYSSARYNGEMMCRCETCGQGAGVESKTLAKGVHHMRFTIRRMMVVVVCFGILCYFVRRMSDPEFGYGTHYSERYSETGFISLRVGMASEQVIAMMGQPLRKVSWSGYTYPVAGGVENWMYSESPDDGSYWRRWVIFNNGKVLALVKQWYSD